MTQLRRSSIKGAEIAIGGHEGSYGRVMDDLNPLFGAGLRETPAQTGRRIRRRLRERWPETAFEVRSDRGSCTVTVRWVGEPSVDEVDAVTRLHCRRASPRPTLWSSASGNVSLVASTVAVVLDRSDFR